MSLTTPASSPNLLEVNFDGLVGPTHNYAGLSRGNVASTSNVGTTSRPRAAALQGIAKMRRLIALGAKQGVLPPHERPHVPTLRTLGFNGDDSEIIEAVYKADPVLLAQVSSASPMWTANAATVAPSTDTFDFRTHLLTANLVSMFHRSIEHPTTARILRAVFNNPARFAIHQALPSSPATGDEGAANHTRLWDDTAPSSPPPLPMTRSRRRLPAATQPTPPSTSSFTAHPPTTRPPPAPQSSLPARRSKPPRPPPARSRSTPIPPARSSSNRTPMSSTPACSTTTSSPSAAGVCSSTTSKRSPTRPPLSPRSASSSPR